MLFILTNIYLLQRVLITVSVHSQSWHKTVLFNMKLIRNRSHVGGNADNSQTLLVQFVVDLL